MNTRVQITTIFGYILVFSASIFVLQQVRFPNLFDIENFINWDAGHYDFIKTNGYEGHRVAFFPLFPYVWKFLSLNRYGISVLNTIVFLCAFYTLIKEFKIKNRLEILLYLSIPSAIFYYVPYSEAIFFLTSLLMLIGLKNNTYLLVYLGLFFAILSRPAFVIFIPALIITELLYKQSKIYLRLSMYAFVTLLGILLVGYIQFLDTGNWFEFFGAQKTWGNELQLPKFPLTSWGSGFAFGMDSLAFLLGTISGIFLIWFMLKTYTKTTIKLSREVIFSLAYLAGITLLVFLYRGGSLFSLNRFVFATPFIIIVFNYWMHQKEILSIKQFLIILGVLTIFWLFFGSYTSIPQFVKFLLLSFYALLFFILRAKKEQFRKYSLMILILLNFSFQVISFVGFLSHKWIG